MFWVQSGFQSSHLNHGQLGRILPCVEHYIKIGLFINPQRASLAGGYTKSLHGSLQVDMDAKGVT